MNMTIYVREDISLWKKKNLCKFHLFQLVSGFFSYSRLTMNSIKIKYVDLFQFFFSPFVVILYISM